MFRNIQIRFSYNKNVILSTLGLNLMVMPIRHNLKSETHLNALGFLKKILEKERLKLRVSFSAAETKNRTPFIKAVRPSL